MSDPTALPDSVEPDDVPEGFEITEITGVIPEPPDDLTMFSIDHAEPTGVVQKATYRVRALVGAVPRAASGPSSRGWGTPSASYGQTNIVKVSGRGITIHMHREVAFIFACLLADLDTHLKRKGKSLAAEADDWGYAHRKIRGRNEWSNHAWGLAADFNAIRNPMTDRLVTEFTPSWVRNLLKGKYRNLIRWGGDYSSRKDAMHFEWMGTVQQARNLSAALKKKPAPSPTPVKGHNHEMPTLRRGAQGDAVRDLQGHLNYAFRAYADIAPLPIDGDYGSRTEIRLREWCKRTGIRVSSTVDATAWNRLHQVTKGARLDAKDRPF